MSQSEILKAFDRLKERPPRDGKAHRIYVAGCSGSPVALFEALSAQPDLAAGCRFSGVWIPGVNKLDWAGLHPEAEADTIFLAPELRDSFQSGRMHFSPLTYTPAIDWVRDCAADFGVVMTSAPDQNGTVSLGLSADFSGEAIEAGRPILALINRAMPAPQDSVRVPLSALAETVEIDAPPVTMDDVDLNPRFEAIAQHVTHRIENGATLQFGLGKVQKAVLESLKDHKGLRLHAGMISDPLLDLMDAGATDEAPESITTGVALGSSAFYDRVAQDPRIRFRPVRYTHAMSTLTALPGPFVAINSVIEVDLFGQANAEFLGRRQISGGGGLADFLAGAAAHPNGQGIVALLSTARGGSISRIVPQLKVPAITLSRQQVDTVITEHGAADLQGTDIDTRAERLISIADPAHRDGLSNAWDQMRGDM